MKMTAFAFSWPSNIQHTKTSRSVYFRKTNPVVRLPFALGAGEISGDMEPSKFEEMNRDEILEVLDKSLRQHTSLGILEQIQIMYNDDDDDDDDDNDLSDSDTGNESQTLIIPSLDMIHTTMRFALVSHGKDEGTIDGALHNYANFGALSTFETRYDILLRIPARKLAPVGNHQYELEDKLQLLRNRIGGRDVVDDYNGFRCTKDQTPIYIRNGLVSSTLHT